jgi:SAM-dependent methyltransferase
LNDIREFFDSAYSEVDRYWWKGGWRYSTQPEDHPNSIVTQLLLRHLQGRPWGRALDLGCGEGTDAIRLAKLGWTVDAVELSKIGAQKTMMFARQEGVPVAVHCVDALTFVTRHRYDVVVCNGVLHYVKDKLALLRKIDSLTLPGGCNAISLWSDFTPVPEPHRVVPTYPDQEEGIVSTYYGSWVKLLMYYDREKQEASHSDFGPHEHSHIKLIAVKGVS